MTAATNPKKNPAARRVRPTPEPLVVPDLFGEEQRQEQSDRMVIQMLANIDAERTRLKVLRIANGVAEDDTDSKVPGEDVTFADRAAKLDADEHQLVTAFGPETMERLPAVLEKMRQEASR